MPRRILTPEEREERRRANVAKFLSSHRTHDGEWGDPAMWRRMAQGLLQKAPDELHVMLARLGLEAMPASPAALKTARNRALFSAHPDQGGTDQMAKDVLMAYEWLLIRMTTRR